jgi:hypothetical protein
MKMKINRKEIDRILYLIENKKYPSDEFVQLEFDVEKLHDAFDEIEIEIKVYEQALAEWIDKAYQVQGVILPEKLRESLKIDTLNKIRKELSNGKV